MLITLPHKRPTKRARVACAATAVAAVAISACGTDGDSGTKAQGSRPAGEPIKLMVIAPTDNTTFVVPELPVAARAAAAHVNAQGGVDERPIDIVYCNDKNDPNLATKCARQAVDEEVMAVVGSASFNMSTTIIPMMEKAHIPVINPQLFGPLEGSSRVVFQTNGSFYAAYSAVGEILAHQDAETVAFIHSESAAAQATVDNVTSSLERAGLDLVADVSVPLNPGSITPVVAEAVNADPDAIIVGTNATINSQIFPALRQMGVDFAQTRIISYSSTANDTMVDQVGPDVMQDVNVVGTFPALSDEAMQDYLSAMDAEDPDHEVTRLDTSAESFSSVLLVAKVAQEISGELTSAALLEALESSGELDLGMGIVGYRPSEDGPNEGAPRLSNNTVFVYRIDNGNFVQGDPHQVLDPYGGAS